MNQAPVVGRFAPSPTGPLHAGSLVAAAGSWLSARSQGGRWLVRMEDLDAPRVRAGSASEILEGLTRYGLEWDGEVEYQSTRQHLYAEALERLRSQGFAYDCACSRADLLRAGSAPAAGDPGDSVAVYPGTCRHGLPAGKTARAIRLRTEGSTVEFDDIIRGRVEENVAQEVGDFVIRRADGLWAYQLAVVVDDAHQGVTEVVRGGDLLSSTARQIALQRLLGLPTPRYAHLPLLVDVRGNKLGKRDGALPLPMLDGKRLGQTLAFALEVLGCDVVPDEPRRMLEQALASFSLDRVRSAGMLRSVGDDQLDPSGDQ